MNDSVKKLSLPIKPKSKAKPHTSKVIKKSSHTASSHRPFSASQKAHAASSDRAGTHAQKLKSSRRDESAVVEVAHFDLMAISPPPVSVAPSSLAYQLTMAAHAAHAVVEGFSLQQVLAVLPIDEVARPNVQRLSFDVMRYLGLVQFWVQRFVEKPPAPWLQAMLWVSLTQLYLREEDEFTLVNQAVAAVEARRPHAKGLVNAILRRFLRERDAWEAAAQVDEVAVWNHPQWWIDQLKSRYSDDWQRILTVNNTRPPMTLRVNARLMDVAGYQALLAQDGRESVALSRLNGDALVLSQPCSVSVLPRFAEGVVSVQDAGAQLSAQLLDVQNGMRVLDACAAPGGKTCHLLEHFDVELLALEKDEVRARRIDENLLRLNLTAQVQVDDANLVKSWWDGVPFDRILLDAPCSASGIVRRHPDIRWLRESEDLEGLAKQQRQLLRSMWQVLAVGGRLLYCTCSIFEDEGESVLAEFLSHTPNAQRMDLPLIRRVAGSDAQLLPRVDDGLNHDGFFYAALVKVA
jgi:16S rRNA (cytosine967-C5)-methyltransferase